MCRRRTVRSSQNHYSVTNQIMLRFRPIAPRPAGIETISGRADKNGQRTKRKYDRVRGRKSNKRKTDEERTSKSTIDEVDEASPEKVIVTLQLLPERSENDRGLVQKLDEEDWNIDEEFDSKKVHAGVVETWITVECVTETFIDSGLGLSDREKINSLQVDTCPGFLSDGTNNVVWVNEAYRKMVGAHNNMGVMVSLVVKEKLPPWFACRVRMIQQTQHGHKWNRIVPCDVWRMDLFAGFAWKLDVNTALGLGI